jgi:spermidine/putrescine transport system permease protein
MKDETMISRRARRGLRAYFFLFLIYLYLPTALLMLFAFNSGTLPQFPLEGFTLHWFSDAWNTPALRSAIVNSILVAAGTSVAATALGLATAYPLARGRFPGRTAVSALALVPLVVPYVVLGAALLIFVTRGPLQIGTSLTAVLIGHVVITFPYTILLLVPRIASIDRRLEEAAYDLGASTLYTFRRVVLPLVAPALLASLLTAFVLSLDEYAVASFVIGGEPTYPVYLFSQLRFAERLPLVIAVAAFMVAVTTLIVIVAEIVRRRGDRRMRAR